MYVVTDVRLVAEPWIAFATVNALLFAASIVLGHRVTGSRVARSEQEPGIDGLALSMIIAAAVALPIGITGAAPDRLWRHFLDNTGTLTVAEDHGCEELAPRT